jgi:hypothetical protein
MPVRQTSHMHHITPLQKDDHIIFLSSWKTRPDPRNKIIYLVERELFDHIRRHHIQYILVGHHRNFLNLYFNGNPSFEKIKHFGSGDITIYKLKDSLVPYAVPTLVVGKLAHYLTRVKNYYPEKYNRLAQDIFIGILNKDPLYVETISQRKNTGHIFFVANKQIYLDKFPISLQEKEE